MASYICPGCRKAQEDIWPLGDWILCPGCGEQLDDKTVEPLDSERP